MSATNIGVALDNLDECWWEVVLSDEMQQATLTFPYARFPSIRSLLNTVHALLHGARKAHCSWDMDERTYHWRFSRHEHQLLIHMLWWEERG